MSEDQHSIDRFSDQDIVAQARAVLERRIADIQAHPDTAQPLTAKDITILRGIPYETMASLVAEITQTIEHAAPTDDNAPEEQSAQPADFSLRQFLENAQQRTHNLADITRIAKEICSRHPAQSNQELPTDLRSVELPDGMIDVANVSENSTLRARCVDHALGVLRDSVFSDMQHYVFFAGTALYLHGTTLPNEQLKELVGPAPADCDVHVWDAREFDRIRERIDNLQEHPDVRTVHYNNEGKAKQLTGQETKKLSGHIDLIEPNGKQSYRYHFEFFFNDKKNDRLFDPVTRGMNTTVNGLRTLTVEGLQRQYAKNMQMEYRVDNAVESVYRLLKDDPSMIGCIADAFRAWEKGDAQGNHSWETTETQAIAPLLQSLHLSPDMLAFYYVLYEQVQQSDPSDARTRNALWMKMTSLLGPFKTKTESREKRARTLQEIQQV